MKLIIAGATGFVATEIIRQSLSIPQITSVIALARRSVSPPSNPGKDADVSKLHSVVISDYEKYSDDVKKKFIGADACIWTVAITPSKSRGVPFEDVRRICHDSTIAGLHAVWEGRHSDGSQSGAPFRFLYMSGTATERDQTKKPSYMPEYCLMRGETENQILSFAAERKRSMEACAAKPGLITTRGQYLKTIFATFLQYVMSVPNIDVSVISAAMLHEVIHGFEKEPLGNDDLVRIGNQALKSG